jgi:hypothetical protein
MDYPVDTDGAPCVALGGQLWPVPVLAARQNRVIDPLILSLLPVFQEWQTDKAAALAKFSASHYEALQEIAFHAIRRARPELSREEFLNLPVTLPELVAAFPVIARQTGIFERAAPGEAQPGEAQPGEDWAGSAPPNLPPQSPPTGTPSSPMSAT